MKRIVLLVAVSLMLVGAMVVIALPDMVQAEKKITKWCVEGGAVCGETQKDCKVLIPAVADAKCEKVIIG